MDVLKERHIDQVVILGSGMSILELSEESINHINKCKVVIAVNKYMAFYKKSKIIPTHIYFHDSFSVGSSNIFHYILQICERDNLKNLTFITNKYYNLVADRNIYLNIIALLIDIVYYRSKPFLKYLFGIKNSERQNLILKRRLSPMKYPKESKIIGVRIHNSKWASTLSDKLFHFRGSLTSVLNYISICFPGKEIYLVGNDFDGGKYFFEEELEKLDFEWKDFTYEDTKKQNTHYSFQDIRGQRMSDRFPYIIKELAKSNNILYCLNPKSLLVLKAGVRYKTF